MVDTFTLRPGQLALSDLRRLMQGGTRVVLSTLAVCDPRTRNFLEFRL